MDITIPVIIAIAFYCGYEKAKYGNHAFKKWLQAWFG